MIIDLIGGTYEQRFKDWNSQRTINWYPKLSDKNEKNKTQIALVPRKGLKEFTDLSGDSVRGVYTVRTLSQERVFAVVGTTLHEIFYDGSSVSRGTLTGMATGSRSKVYMSVNLNGELMVQDSEAGYYLDLATNTLSPITDLDYPGGTTLDYADGYFLISDKEGRVTFSNLGSASEWDGSNFFTPTFKPDKVKAVRAIREEVYCFGDETIEIYINDGVSPFSRQSRTSSYYGLTAKDSVAIHSSGVFFLGKSRFGGSDIYMMGNDYSVTPISTPAIAGLINEQTNEDAEGFVYSTKDGHIFYLLHLPSLETTLVYDITTGMWHERQSQKPGPDADGTKNQDMYRGRNHVSFKGLNLFGDWFSGKIFIEDGKTDDGNIRVLERTSSVFQQEQKSISVTSLEFDINSGFGTTSGQGVDPIMILKYSIDGGNTFEKEEFISLGDLGHYDERIRIPGLGTARNWVINFKITDPIDIIVMQAVVHGETSEW